MTARISTVVAAALLAFSVSTSAQTVPSRSGAPDRFAVSGREASATAARNFTDAARALLHKRVKSIDWTETPFEEVVSWLEDESEGRVNIVPRWLQLARVHVDRDTPVTLRLDNVTVAEILNEAMGQLSPDGEVSYRGAGNRLTLSTRADFSRKMMLRVYDVADIVTEIPDFGRGAPTIDFQQTGGQTSGGQAVIRGTGGSGTGGEQAEQYTQTRLEELARKIQRVIAPESWETPDTAGRGRIEIFGRSLWIYNTVEVHEQIAGSFSLGH